MSKSSLTALMDKGSWIAELRELANEVRYARLEPAHTVVVDGFDKAGNILIRDPAGQKSYQMTRADFLKHWTGIAVYKQ